MRVTRRTVLAATGSSAILAGCTGDEDDGAGPGSGDAGSDGESADDGDAPDGGESTDGETSADATVQVRSLDAYGDVLVGPDGLTLYNFDSDDRDAGESTCYDGCAENWPPLTVADDPSAGDGVEAELTAFERDDGERQVAANGWPLYYFAPDADPGDAAGQGVNDVWWVLGPDGSPIREMADDDGGGDDGDTGY